MSSRLLGLLRLVGLGWWLQLKIRSRSAFDGLLGILYPLFFATTVFLMYRQGNPSALLGASVGASVMGVWSATSTSASGVLQWERRQGTLELLVAAPVAFPLLITPITLSMATVGLYSMLATLLWGRVAFGISVHLAHPGMFAAGVLVTVLAIGLMGFVLAVTAVRYPRAWALGSALEFPVWLVCGFLVPLHALPLWTRPLSWALPPTWGFAAIRDGALGGQGWADAGICLALGLAYALVGALASGRLVDSARARATLALT
jgi:ABC-2 type transport system permease protein